MNTIKGKDVLSTIKGKEIIKKSIDRLKYQTDKKYNKEAVRLNKELRKKKNWRENVPD